MIHPDEVISQRNFPLFPVKSFDVRASVSEGEINFQKA